VHLDAYGLYGAFFVKGGGTPFFAPLFVHSFVRLAPRAFFRPDRNIPIAVARSGGQGRRFFRRRRRLVLDQREHGGKLP
jgi:hypothetical protein